MSLMLLRPSFVTRAGSPASLLSSVLAPSLGLPASRMVLPSVLAANQQRLAHYKHDLRPRRSVLYLPGFDVKKATKAAKTGADVVCLDCEDAVSENKKDECRSSIVQILETVDFGRTEKAVRMNPVGSPHALKDLQTLFSGKVLPDALVVPKVDELDQLKWLFENIEKILSKRQEQSRIKLFTMVESARALMNLRALCEIDQSDIFESLILDHEVLIFGGDDYAATVGARRTVDNHELMYARQMVVAHAKAYGLQVIDIVNTNFNDMAILEKESIEGANFGFDGKQVIHPNQVAVVQKCFSPSLEQVAHAQRVVAAFTEHSQKGTGAFTIDGKMVDMPIVKQCQNVLKLHEANTAPPPSSSPSTPTASSNSTPTKEPSEKSA